MPDNTTPTEDPALVLMARAILKKIWPRLTDLQYDRVERVREPEWAHALSYAQAAFSVLPVEKGSDVANREDFSSEPLRASELPTEAKSRPYRVSQGHDRNSFNRGIRASVTWLHAEAETMSDPHARGILNGAAWRLGQEKLAADGDNQSPSVDPSAPLSEPIDFPSNNTEGERL